MRDVARAAMLSKRFMFCKSTGKKEGNYFSKGKMLIMYVFSKGIVLVEWPSLKSKVQKNQEGLLMSITFYCGVLIHCPFLMIVLWKRTMPGYQSPSAKQSTQKIAISKLNSLQHYLSLSTGYTIAASSKWHLEENQNSPQNYWVDAPCTKKHSVVGAPLEMSLNVSLALDGPSILTHSHSVTPFETKRWHSTADVWNGELQSWNLRPGRQSLKRVSASHRDQPTWPRPSDIP